MHPRIILAIARKDMLDVLRNRYTLFALLTPIFLAVIYWILSVALKDAPLPVAVYNPGNSALIRRETLPPETEWNLVLAPSADAVRSMVDTNEQRVSAGIVIPADADALLRRGVPPQVQVYFDASKLSAARQQVFLARLVQAGEKIAGRLPVLAVTSTPLHLPADPATAAGTGSRPETIFGLITLLVGLISAGMLLVPVLIVEEKEKKTLRLILSAPASYADVIAGKLLVGLAYTLILGMVLLGAAGLPPAALPQIVLFALLGGIFFLLVGLTLGALSKTTTEVNSYGGVLMMIWMVPMMLNMPGMALTNGFIGTLIRFIPNFYIVDGMRRALDGTTSLEIVVLDAGITVALTAGLFVLAALLLRRQQRAAA